MQRRRGQARSYRLGELLCLALPIPAISGKLTASWAKAPLRRIRMTRSPFRRLVFGALRRLLYLWVRSETINQSSFTLNLDRSRPVFYALQNPSLADLAVLDRECRKAGLPRPVLPVVGGNLSEPAAFFYLTPEPDWLGRQDKSGAPPVLERLVGAVSQNAAEDAQIIPVSVFWASPRTRKTARGSCCSPTVGRSQEGCASSSPF